MKNSKPLILLLLVTVSFQVAAQNIYRTACQGNLSRLDSMLSTTDINVQDERGRSLLHWAVACRKQPVFEFLVKQGISINTEDNDGATPLYMSVQYNNEPLFDALIDLQPNKNWIGQYGASLVERAIRNKSKVFTRKLIEKGVDVHVLNKRGSTPLEIARKTRATEISALLISLGADESKVRTFVMEGPYMGQSPPGLIPKVFAPNFISIEEYEFGSVFNREGTEFYYGVDVNGKPEIRYSRLIDNRWTEPVILLSHELYGYNDPFLSPDENRLYFISRRAMDGKGDLKKDHDIWYVKKVKNGWSEPINAGPNINSDGNEYYISFTHDGTMYFSSNVNAPEERRQSDLDIYYSKFINGEFQKAVSLGDSINTPGYDADVFVAPDESYLIFCSTRRGGLGRGDLYISFKNSDGTWTKSINMGNVINTRHHELCPFVTKDGKYFFYTSNEDIYWVDTKIFEDLRKQKNR